MKQVVDISLTSTTMVFVKQNRNRNHQGYLFKGVFEGKHWIEKAETEPTDREQNKQMFSILWVIVSYLSKKQLLVSTIYVKTSNNKAKNRDEQKMQKKCLI